MRVFCALFRQPQRGVFMENSTSIEQKLQQRFDLLIICGDFQSIRQAQDLDDMHCPQKYKQMGSFREYFEGTRQARLLTVFIGGNHQAVNSLRQSHFGGWVAPKIYFLGQAGSIIVKKGSERLRITGCSGIYNNSDFKYCTRVEKFPLRGKDRITAYHTKQVDIYRLQLLANISLMKKEKPELYGPEGSTFDIMLSHDWPKDIALFGQQQELYKVKPFFQKEIQAGTLGSPPMLRLLKTAKPSYWFSAHMHVKYPAIYPHAKNQFTHFLSLDKCLGQRSCIQLLQFQASLTKPTYPREESQLKMEDKVAIQVDPVWTAVLILTRDLMKGGDNLYYFDKQQIKLVDVTRMNKLIERYPEVRSKVGEWGPLAFDEKLGQREQTLELLRKMGIELSEVEGVCLQRQVQETVQDEIDLDL